MNRKVKNFLVLILVPLALTACEDTNIDIDLATEAGLEAIKAATLSDEDVRRISFQAAQEVDGQYRIASPDNAYAQRLERLVGSHLQEEGIAFNYKVYLEPTVNAFAMGDGTIRVYQGLMEMMDDGELRFVIGHEMGHVVRKHLKKKLMLAYGGSAVRKGLASQDNVAGDIARSELGGLLETIVNAQFSQQEEREADDYGMEFLKEKGYQPASAVSALRKLAKLGNEHSFLSSHPAPEKRAERLVKTLNSPAGEPTDPEEASLWRRITDFLVLLLEKVKQLSSSVLGKSLVFDSAG